MLISMQGNYTIAVKGKEAAYPQRFVVAGATSGNGTYDGVAGMAPVPVTGDQWSIAILNDPGTGYRLSDTRIKFPVLTSGNFQFDVESNDAGADQDFNDLVLTCSSPASIFDYFIYGNVSLYSNNCIFNPCNRRWLVIDTYSQFLKALEIDKIKEVITKLYPERIPGIRIPNPPDPPAYFTPIMINLLDEEPLPVKKADLFRRMDKVIESFNEKDELKNGNSSKDSISNFRFQSSANLSQNTAANTSGVLFNKAELAKIAEGLKYGCFTEPGANLTLNFAEYDRSISELAGGPYSGTGNRTNLGNAITDMNGNYIFRFTQSFSELVNEILYDVAPGENVFVQARPDIIVKVTDSLHPSVTLFESAPYFNVPQLRRIDICLPLEKVRPTSLCFNGNLIGSLGNVYVGGAQNVSGSFSSGALDRNGYNNHLTSDGKITVHNTQAAFSVDCACWGGLIDVKGCMFNIKRQKDDPVIRHYTIRYKKPGATWQFVNQTYLHPKFSKRFIPNYNGDQVGPFPVSLRVDGGSPQTVSAYINIQSEVFYDGIDWEWSNLDRYMQLDTSLYDAGIPGTVYFLVEGYDGSGNLVPGAKDLIALYINNRRLDFGLGNITFNSPLISLPCGLYRMTSAQLNTPLTVQFKANDVWGFVDNYQFSISKCPQQISVDITSPASIAGTNSTGLLASGSNGGNTDTNGCPGYTGTLADFGTTGFVDTILQPSASEGGWLRAGEQFAVISFGLTADIRKTNGYNTGIDGTYQTSAQFYLELI